MSAEEDDTTYHPFGYGEFDSPSGIEREAERCCKGQRCSGHSAVGDNCGPQEVECWVRQLRAAGWLPVNVRTGKEVVGATTWKSPNGELYRGPYKAWLVMKAES